MSTAALFTIAKICMQDKCPSTDKWIKMCHIYIDIMEYCSVIKKNNILSFATIWMDLEDIMLS